MYTSAWRFLWLFVQQFNQLIWCAIVPWQSETSFKYRLQTEQTVAAFADSHQGEEKAIKIGCCVLEINYSNVRPKVIY